MKKIETIKFRGWKIVKNESGNYDAYLPDDAEAYRVKDLVELCTPEIEDIPTIAEMKHMISKY